MWAFETRSSTDHFGALPSQFPKISHLCKNRTGLNVAPPPFLHFWKQVLKFFRIFCTLFVLMLCLPSLSTAQEKTVRILTSSAQMQSEKAITNEFEILLAQELNRRRVNVDVSRKRMELPSIQEQIDLVCFVKPEWLGESAAYYEWTKTPLVNVQIIFVGDKSSPLITSMADVKGKRVGAIFGFRYPGLDKLFHEQFALRDDALQRLGRGVLRPRHNLRRLLSHVGSPS